MFGYNKEQHDDELDIITLMIRSCVQVARTLLVSLKLRRQVEEIKAIKEIDIDDLEHHVEEKGASEQAISKHHEGGKDDVIGGLELELEETFNTSSIMI